MRGCACDIGTHQKADYDIKEAIDIKGEAAFNKGMSEIINDLTAKYQISRSKLLNSGKNSGEELAARTADLKTQLKVNDEDFETLFKNYLKLIERGIIK